MSDCIFSAPAVRPGLLILALYCLAFPAMAQPASASAKTPQEAVTLVKKVIAYLHKNGSEKTFREISTPGNQFSDGHLYAFVLGTDGVCHAHGAYPNLIGKDLRNLRDPDGIAPALEFLKIANSKEGKGWVQYRWPHPLTHRMAYKRSYIERDGKWVIGTGISNEHQDKPSSQPSAEKAHEKIASLSE